MALRGPGAAVFLTQLNSLCRFFLPRLRVPDLAGRVFARCQTPSRGKFEGCRNSVNGSELLKRTFFTPRRNDVARVVADGWDYLVPFDVPSWSMLPPARGSTRASRTEALPAPPRVATASAAHPTNGAAAKADVESTPPRTRNADRHEGREEGRERERGSRSLLRMWPGLDVTTVLPWPS